MTDAMTHLTIQLRRRDQRTRHQGYLAGSRGIRRTSVGALDGGSVGRDGVAGWSGGSLSHSGRSTRRRPRLEDCESRWVYRSLTADRHGQAVLHVSGHDRDVELGLGGREGLGLARPGRVAGVANRERFDHVSRATYPGEEPGGGMSGIKSPPGGGSPLHGLAHHALTSL
jgi:hypothetical protein